jgi:hypothetical protein
MPPKKSQVKKGPQAAEKKGTPVKRAGIEKAAATLRKNKQAKPAEASDYEDEKEDADSDIEVVGALTGTEQKAFETTLHGKTRQSAHAGLICDGAVMEHQDPAAVEKLVEMLTKIHPECGQYFIETKLKAYLSHRKTHLSRYKKNKKTLASGVLAKYSYKGKWWAPHDAAIAAKFRAQLGMAEEGPDPDPEPRVPQHQGSVVPSWSEMSAEEKEKIKQFKRRKDEKLKLRKTTARRNNREKAKLREKAGGESDGKL